MRFCENCGTQLGDGVRFCPNCGAQVAQSARQAQTDTQAAAQTAQPETTAQAAVTPAANTAEKTVGMQEPLHATVVTQTPTPKTNGFAVAGFVLGICSILFGWLCCFNITSVLGLVFSIIGLCQIGGKKGSGKGLAVAGLVLSILSILLLVGFGLFTQAFEVYFSPNGDSYRIYDDILTQI